MDLDEVIQLIIKRKQNKITENESEKLDFYLSATCLSRDLLDEIAEFRMNNGEK